MPMGLTSGRSEKLEIVRNSNDSIRVRIKASKGFFLQDHWRAFIVEDDFKFISQKRINSVRIPVGWWIASDPTPPQPCVGGSLKALDNAFLWALKYESKVVIDQHAAPDSQNGWELSSSTDGSQEWDQTDANAEQTVDVIDFLTAGMQKSPSLYAVELMNERRAPGASLDSATKYYKAGDDAVRKHSPAAYVVMSNRLSSDGPRELFPRAGGLTGSVIDVHYYNLFSDVFNGMRVQQNIDFIHTNRSAQLNYVTTAGLPKIC
ncbi:hypothetical protein POPTR_002G093000v4 [Populus trichocarpa]|uniref:Uncharacterized protein n=1 Tax=Populus trichocarpa TaxID=3694 RepID=A0ACC0TD43_POPTR|nr:hypothetical protein POPTR_002G093000v4 [Populus trichocarpa]